MGTVGANILFLDVLAKKKMKQKGGVGDFVLSFKAAQYVYSSLNVSSDIVLSFKAAQYVYSSLNVSSDIVLTFSFKAEQHVYSSLNVSSD